MTFSVLGGGSSRYNIDRSLRFRSSASAYLNRTFGSGSQTTSTVSLWVKRGKLGAQQNIMGVNGGGSNDAELFFDGGDTITFASWNGGSRPLGTITTSQVFRDPSAWYHLVFVIDTTNATASNRLRIYVNGVLAPISSSSYPAQNATWYWNGSYGHVLGVYANPAQAYFDGYLAEVNFIDGQALTPSSFGEFSAVTGVWVPKKYTGTYGTNGFYLDFKNNTSATTLAYDKSGNGNNWTANNISTTAGATYDSMTDVPTLTSATAANYAVLNPINKDSQPTITNGNLTVSMGAAGGGWRTVPCTIAMPSGKWYAEVVFSAIYGSISARVGIAATTDSFFGLVYPGLTATSYVYANDGQKANNNTTAAYGATWTTGDVIGIAFDASAGTITFYKNNVSQGTAYSSISAANQYYFIVGGANVTNICDINFGQRPFSYTPPTGFKALNTFNLPDPVIKKPNQYMDATLWTGNGTNNRSISGINFQPDMVWLKSRSAAYDGLTYDSVRTAGKSLTTSSTGVEVTNNTNGYLSSFDSNGFTVSVGSSSTLSVNELNTTYVGWQWKESATSGFDIVTYTGDGVAGRTVSHSLGVAPAMVIVKARSAGGANYEWCVQHKSIPATQMLLLSNTIAATTSATFNNQYASSTTLYLGSNTGSNQSGVTYVAYLFAEIPQFSKFGSYTGNGSADGPFVYCGFRPKYVMVKSADAATYGQWRIWDTTRSPYNAIDKGLQANTSDAEYTEVQLDAVSNGFKIRGTFSGLNASGQNLIYAAFAENPFKYSLAR